MIRTLLIMGPAERPMVLERLGESAGERTVEVVVAATVAEAAPHCTTVDCILLWAGSDTPDALRDLDQLLSIVSAKPVIVLTDVADADNELEFFRRGARDYLTDADVHDGRLVRSIAYAVAHCEPDGRLPHSDQHYRSIVEALGEGVVVQSGDGTILSMNRRAGEIFGIGEASPVGRRSGEVGWTPLDDHGRELLPEQRPGFRCFTTGQPVRNQLMKMPLADGTVSWVEASSYPLRHAANASAHGVVTVLREVTEQRAAEDSVRFQALLLGVVGQSVIATDLAGRILHWNEASERIFGWTADEVLGRDILTVTAFEPTQLVDEIMSRAAQGETWTGDLWSHRRDGSRFPILVTNTPIRDADGVVTGMVGVTTDISERLASEAANRRLSSIVESSTDAIYGTDLDGAITSWNGGAVALYGYPTSEVLGRNVRLLYPDDLLQEQTEVLQRMRAGRPFHGHDTVRKHRDGNLIEVSVKASPVLDTSGNPIAAAAIARDITDRKTLERTLAQDRDRLAEAQRVAKLGSLDRDPITGQHVWSAELYRMFGVDPATIPDDSTYLGVVHPDDRLRIRQAIWEARQTGNSIAQIEHRIALPTGEVRWVSAHTDSTPGGTTVGAVLDITDRKEAEEALAHQSLHDPLTGLPNRILFERRLEALIAHRVPGCAAVLFIDVDRFKIINDGMGHAAGDDLLIAIGERLSSWAEQTDTVARFGGDEFVILCEGVGNMSRALDRATSLIELCERTFSIGERQIFITVSIGVAEVPIGAEVESVLGEADAAMYRAKDRGRARIVVADQALRARATERMELETALRGALERSEFCLHYQPVVDLHTDQVLGYEALIRWNHPQRGLVYPDHFVDLAEETGLIVPIGRWVLREALSQLKAWHAASDAMASRFVAVNLSTVQLYDADLARQVRDALNETSIDAHLLNLEITETALMDIARATKTLTALKSIGVDIELDDFGTGYSSLSYLQQLPIDTIKIDRSFVAGLGQDTQATSIVAAVVSLGCALDLRVLAEGVETDAQRDQLRRLGCGFGQGYLWSRPLPADRLLALDGTQRRHATSSA